MAATRPRAPFTLDVVVRFLDQTICSPFAGILLAILLRRRVVDRLDVDFHPRANWWAKALVAWIALKTTHRALTRLVVNRGWKRDRPRWDRDAVVLITGGSGGIGGDLVDLLAKRTNKIAVLDVVTPMYKAKNVNWYKCDITSPEAIAEVAKQVRKDLGHPTILVNNAGVARGRKILDLTAEQFMFTYKVNTLGAFNILKEFLPHIVKQNHGHVMTVASSASYMSIAQLSEYACSKSAALALHEVLNEELIHRYNAPRVRTSIVCPTKVNTQMGRGMKAPPNAFFSPVLESWQVAQDMENAINSGLSAHIVTPLYASLLLPSIRALPDYWRHYVHYKGETPTTVTDKDSEAARVALRRADGYESP